MKDKNQFKQLLEFVKKNKVMNDSPLKYELTKKTELTKNR